MPTDLLLPAFALTLVLNAVFVAVAFRSLREERSRRVPPRVQPWPVSIADPEASTPDAAIAGSELGDEAPISPEGRDVHDPAPVDPPAEPPVRPAPEPPAGPAPGPEPPVGPAPEPAPATPGPTPRSTGPGRRRKFSLPPLDDDHDKVDRSIRTFLTATEAAPPPPSAVASAPATLDPGAGGPSHRVVTVAAIQILGGGQRDVLERTVRSSARATDEVSVDRRGRVRVVLGGSGELAAHAYLRRIRATVEPIVEAADPSSRVVVATATELHGDVATARRRADRRLTVALRGAAPAAVPSDDPADDPAEDEPAPRAAGV